MNHFRRAISGLLCLALTGSLCTIGRPASAAENSAVDLGAAVGSIALTVRFDFPQLVREVEERDLFLSLTGQGKDLTFHLNDGSAETPQGVEIQAERQNSQGTPLTTERLLGRYHVTLEGLPQGRYTLSLSGKGYTTCTAEVTLEDYSQHMLLRTGDGTFSLGDLDGDGSVTLADRQAMDAQLGRTGELDTYDLNGDGAVDVTDLSYINKAMGLEGTPKILSTTALVSAQVDAAGLEVTGQLSHLLTGKSTVTLAPASGQEVLAIPITLAAPVEMNEIVLTTPLSQGSVQAGTALVELEDGTQLTVPFDISPPEGVHAIGRAAGQSVISINLGQKVPVKKITITVTKVEGQTGSAPEFAAVSQIQFLKDIVSDAIAADTQVKGLAASAGDGEVTLIWDEVRNVTGYTVAYGTSKDRLDQSLEVNTNRAQISGLKNNQTWYFQVTAVSDGWHGTPSAVLSAVPLPASVPGAPSNLLVEAADSSLRVSWGSTKDAAYYQVFYRVRSAETFLAWGGNLTATNTVITGLTNGTEYEVAVKAGNQKGTGPYSSTALGTPKLERFTMPELPVDGRIPNSTITSITMENPSNVDWSLCPQFDLSTHLTDNDPNTYWIARHYSISSNITYTFDQSHDMNYVLVVPYLDARYKGRIKTFNLTAKDADGQVLYSANSLWAGSITADGYYILKFPAIEGVRSLTVGLNEVEGGPRVSISEIAFYRSDTLADDIAALFADHAFTRLNAAVDADTISALRARLTALGSFYLDLARLTDELDLAQALLEGRQDALALVKSGFQSRSAAADQAAGQTASDLQPLGVSVKANSTVAIYAQLPDDAAVWVVPTQFYGESGVWKGTPVALKNGRNYLTIPQIGSLSATRGGMLYLTYAGSRPEEIRLQIRGSSGVYQTPILELSGWYDLTEAARRDAIRSYVRDLEVYVSSLSGDLAADIRNATEISTPSVLLSLPADQVLSGLRGLSGDEEAMTETMYQNVLAWEEELFVANQLQGIVDAGADPSLYRYPMTTRQNIRYMRMFAGAFMYAAGSHVGVEYGSTAALVQGKPSTVTSGQAENGLFGWGIAHEIGHNMDKLGKAETTNNLYSLALQAWDGGSMLLSTRLTADGRWEDIFNKTAQGRPGAANNVFVQLGMYWQLHLAYDQAELPLAFYNQFFRLWKSGAYGEYSYDERVALIASQVADRDLTAFFTRWGMTLSDGARTILAGYPQEDRAIWYLNDASRVYRLLGGAPANGSASVTARAEDAQVTLTMTHSDSSSILGYEIRRNGIAIAFTTQSSYVDELGAANNLTYTYSVIPVDKLGNPGGEVFSEEIRVAYDKVIDSDLYTLTRAGDTVTITMKDGTAVPVTGVKLTGSGLDGAYTVRVKSDPDAAEWTVAKTGVLSGDGTADYFTKPGAVPSDTRIWTYDAAVLELTGIPEGTTVALLDYPGDRVDFYEGAAVGVLKQAYGDIPAGTLVILGTYRGDPVYNTLEIEAIYNTTPEAGSVTTIQRPMNGAVYLLAEIPEDGAVSDTSDGFFLFVPDLEKEAQLNAQSGVTDPYPLEIRANLYRADVPDSQENRRLTSRTLWLSFPDGGTGAAEDQTVFPEIVLNSQEGLYVS